MPVPRALRPSRGPDAAARAAVPGAFVRLSRGFVRYELSGPEDGPLAVLVGGLSVPYSTWDRTVPGLASAGFRVLRYDHYGRGFSDRPRARHCLDLYVEQLAELLGALAPGRPEALIGLSMGGAVVAAAVARGASEPRAAVLVDPLSERTRPAGFARLLAAPVLGDAMMALRGRDILVAAQRGDFLDEAAYREFLPTYLPPLGFRGLPRAVLAAIRSIPSWPLAESFGALGRSGLPVLLVWGREDATLPLEQGERLLGLLPGAAFRVVEGAGHVPQWERPVEVNRAIVDFLRRI